MIFLTATTDTIEVVTDAAATVHTSAHAIDAAASGLAVSGAVRQNQVITTGTTTTVLAAPAAATTRTLKQLTIRNKDATLSVNVTVQMNLNGTVGELHKVLLTPGDMLEYIEGVGFFICTNVSSSVLDSNAFSGQVASGADTYLTGASLGINGLIQVGSFFRISATMTKTAAGTATPAWTVRAGTAGTTADTGIATLTHASAQTAAADTGSAWIEGVVTAVGASATLEAILEFNHKNTTTGLASAAQVQIIQAASSAFNSGTSGMIVGLSCNPGASGVWTFQSVTCSWHNLIKQR